MNPTLQACLDFEPPTVGTVGAWMCVLASGSGGNCSVLVVEHDGGRHAYLIDLGLSPRRTCRELAALGLSMDDVEAVLLTHLDSDHYYAGWLGKLPGKATILLHRRHLKRAQREGVLYHRSAPLDGPLALPGGLSVNGALHAHDALGVSVFRFEWRALKRSLGFATDVGKVTDELVEHLSGVDVLAIESNYCPVLQRDSGRPEYLKRRIMGGLGHLSNRQCGEAVARIAPREHVVLLHLSRQCNTPELALAAHCGASYRTTLTSQDRPTGLIGLVGQGTGKAGGGPIFRTPASVDSRA